MELNFMKHLYLLLSCTIFLNFIAFTQHELKPGFDFREAEEFAKINFQFYDTVKDKVLPKPESYSRRYHSKVTGFDNCFDFWVSNDGNVGCLSFRGTINTLDSWGVNFYSSMIPAKGEIKLPNGYLFNYQFAESEKAAVHEGWAISVAYMWREIDSIVNDFLVSGGNDLIVSGHSQGGALATLVSAQLLQQKQLGKLPKELRLKTYTVAAPKSGNLFFALDVEYYTQFGWSYNLVNPLDWVHLTPFSLTTTNDFVEINPFSDAKKNLNDLPLLQRMYLKRVYRKLDHSSKNAVEQFDKFFGRKLKRQLIKNRKGIAIPTAVNSFAYVRSGDQIALRPDANYYVLFPQNPNDLFLNHDIAAHLYLLKILEENDNH